MGDGLSPEVCRGWQATINAVKRVVNGSINNNVKYLTLYSFSTENWKRPRKEIEFLFSLMESNLMLEMNDLHAQNIRVCFLGRIWELPEKLQKIIRDTENLTLNNTGLHLSFAINYGGRQEIIDAVKHLFKKDFPVGKLDEISFGKFLYNSDLPDVDLLIRTAGEQRLSNFLIWQSAYAEFYFTRIFWPDFSEKELKKAIDAFAKRRRRFGGL